MGLKERIKISFVGSYTLQNNDKKSIRLTSLDKQKYMLSLTDMASSCTFVRPFPNRKDLNLN